MIKKKKQGLSVLYFLESSGSQKINEMELSKQWNTHTSPDHEESRKMMLYQAEKRKLTHEIENIKKKLKEAILCPVCLKIPRSEQIPICRNGHITCESCYR